MLHDQNQTIAAIGVTNQRETVVAWSRVTGRPVARAIVWQDRRTAARCEALASLGAEPMIRRRTGLVLDPYFSATKLEWLFRNGVDVGSVTSGEVIVGTIDSWLLWNLTGGTDGGVHATDPSNAARTLLYDIGAHEWSDELMDLFGVPARALGEVRPSSGRFGMTDRSRAAGIRAPVSGIAGDQQAALFGQACFTPGMTKNTYGTGSFVLTNVGTACPTPVDGLLSTIAWQLGDEVTYAYEGTIYITGAAIQWLRDGLGLIGDASEIEALANSVPDAGGVTFVPALTGLGSPYWDPHARGVIVGLTRGTTRAHLARATLDAIVLQVREVTLAIGAACGFGVTELRVDGGASVMDSLCQLQADALGVPVRRARLAETTALGAAYLAGLAEGVWPSPDAVSQAWSPGASFVPAVATQDATAQRERRLQEWADAVACARHQPRTSTPPSPL